MPLRRNMSREDLTEPEMVGIIIVKEYEDGSLTWETNYEHEYMIDLLEDLIEEAEEQYVAPTLN